MSVRTFTLSGTLLDVSGAPRVGLAIPISLIVPGNVPAVDTDSKGVLPDLLSPPVVTDGAGHFSIDLIYPGDVSPAGCIYSITIGNSTILSPADFAYSSTIAITDWYTAASGAVGTLPMSHSLALSNDSPVSGRYLHITPQQNTVAPNSKELSATEPLDVLLDGTGTGIVYLWPTLSLTAPTDFTCRIDGEPTKLSFSVPDHPTGYVGVYDGATTYHVHDGAAFQNIYTPGLVAPDVVSYSGAYYVAIADTTGHLPTNATYFAPWIAEPITWHLTPFGTVQGIPLPATIIGHDANVPALVGDPVQSPATLSDDLHNLAARTGLALTWLGAWSNVTAYRTYEVVSLAGALSVCILAHTGHTPPNATYWLPLSTLADATTGATGVVELRTAASGSHPVVLSTDDLGAASGVAELDSGGHVPLAELSGITHTQLSASAGITAGQVASVNPSALTGSGTVPAAGLPDGTTTAVGGVETDHSTPATFSHPAVMTRLTNQLGSASALAQPQITVESVHLATRLLGGALSGTLTGDLQEFDLQWYNGNYYLAYHSGSNTVFKTGATEAALWASSAVKTVANILYPSILFDGTLWHFWGWNTGNSHVEHYTSSTFSGSNTLADTVSTDASYDPQIRQNPLDGLYYEGYTATGTPGKVGIRRASSLAGPWTDLGLIYATLGDPVADQFDPTPAFWGGRAYLFYSGGVDGSHAYVQLVELDPSNNYNAIGTTYQLTSFYANNPIWLARPDQPGQEKVFFVTATDTQSLSVLPSVGALSDPTTTEGDLLYRHLGTLARLLLGTGLSISGGVLNASTPGTSPVDCILMTDGVTAPPVPLTTEDGTDWLYAG